jgi:hypothetical protein
MAGVDDDDLDLEDVDEDDVLMFEGLPVTSQMFKITGAKGSVDPRSQFDLAGLPSKTRIRGTFEGVVVDIEHKKVPKADEMVRIHKIKIDDQGFVRLTRLLKEKDHE